MDNFSSPSAPTEGAYLTPKMIEDSLEYLWGSHEKSEDRRRCYYRALSPLLSQIGAGDYEGIYAVVRLVQSAFYEPIHPETARECLEILHQRGITEFD
jgi:hypothetical protein